MVKLPTSILADLKSVEDEVYHAAGYCTNDSAVYAFERIKSFMLQQEEYIQQIHADYDSLTMSND